MIKATEQTTQQLDRFFRKVAEKFPSQCDNAIMTDIHVRFNQETGEPYCF